MTDKIDNYPDIKSIIKAIRKKEIVDYYEVPEELRNNHEIVKEERKLKVRTISARGYDVLRNVFSLMNWLIK